MARGKSTVPVEVSSKWERKRKEEPAILDPRFNPEKFNPLKHTENYQFLYSREKDHVDALVAKGENVKSIKSRITARERFLKLKMKEKERRDLEIELVKQGKTPYYLSSKKRKLVEAIDTAQEKGVEHVLSKIKKKQKEKENRSRGLIE
ncbi:ribosomal RNA-processing protein 36 [Nematocida displodere]|uniref:rRNA biogenesis protein RRP36 n=1 Tax=Nematocida displodere TaxID=1805483 RepID=A0A177EDV5_9MICR|nr:ribosomal RNA-processing protein 36 [Nematocida displodere]